MFAWTFVIAFLAAGRNVAKVVGPQRQCIGIIESHLADNVENSIMEDCLLVESHLADNVENFIMEDCLLVNHLLSGVLIFVAEF